MMIKVTRVNASSSDHLSSQSFVFSFPSDVTGKGEEDYLIVMISASGEDIFSQIKKVGLQTKDYFCESSLPNKLKLEETYNLIKSELEDAQILQILILFINQGKVYLQNWGKHQAYLKRDINLINLTSKLKDGQLLVGSLKPQDKILLASSRLDTNLTFHQSSDKESVVSFWDQSLIDQLFTINVEDLEDAIEDYLFQLTSPEPISICIINNLDSGVVVNNPKFTFSNLLSKINIQALLTKLLFVQKVISFLTNNKKRLISFLAGLAIIVSITSFALVNYRKNNQVNFQYNYYYRLAGDKLKQAQQSKTNDKEEAKSAISAAKYDIEQALKILPKSEQAKKLQEEIEASREDIYKIYHITSFPVFLSLDLLKQNFSADKLAYFNNQILLLSNTDKTLVLLDLVKKSNQLLAGADKLGSAQFGDLNGQLGFIYSIDRGVLRVDTQSKKVITVISSDYSWGDITDLSTFGSNIYLLDASNRNIIKYTATDTGYSEKVDYLQEGQGDSLDNPKRIIIDGSIWVLETSGKLIKFTGGYLDNLLLEDNLGLSKISAFFVSENSDNLYILDSDNSRMLIFSKDGHYLSQYAGDKFKTARDLVADEKNKKLYLLEGNKIYQLDLK